MTATLVVLTGASGSGKTTLARAVESARLPGLEVVYFDSIGVPSLEVMATYGPGPPGEAWQRTMTIQWMERIAMLLRAGTSVLFEGQMRIAFVLEALSHARIEGAHIILVDCGDATRTRRLCDDRNQPELANPDTMNWSRYLRGEATAAGCETMDTSAASVNECRDGIIARFATR